MCIRILSPSELLQIHYKRCIVSKNKAIKTIFIKKKIYALIALNTLY